MTINKGSNQGSGNIILVDFSYFFFRSSLRLFFFSSYFSFLSPFITSFKKLLSDIRSQYFSSESHTHLFTHLNTHTHIGQHTRTFPLHLLTHSWAHSHLALSESHTLSHSFKCTLAHILTISRHSTHPLNKFERQNLAPVFSRSSDAMRCNN